MDYRRKNLGRTTVGIRDIATHLKHCKSTTLQKKIEIELSLTFHGVLLNEKHNLQIANTSTN